MKESTSARNRVEPGKDPTCDEDPQPSRCFPELGREQRGGQAVCQLSPWAAHLTPVCRLLREGLRWEWPGGASAHESTRADRFVLGLSQASRPILPSRSGLPEALGYCHLSRSADTHVPGGGQWAGLREAPSV